MLTLSERNKRLTEDALSKASLLIISESYTPLMAWATAHASTIQLKSVFIITTNSIAAVKVGTMQAACVCACVCVDVWVCVLTDSLTPVTKAGDWGPVHPVECIPTVAWWQGIGLPV